MDVDILSEVVINRPQAEVSAYVSDPTNVPEWYINVKSVEWQTSLPLREGSEIAFAAYFLGRHLDYIYDVIELLPNEKLVMQTSEGPFKMETTYTWETTSNGNTRMTLRNRGTLNGFSAWVTPFITLAMRNANLQDLAQLKQVLEKQ